MANAEVGSSSGLFKNNVPGASLCGHNASTRASCKHIAALCYALEGLQR